MDLQSAKASIDLSKIVHSVGVQLRPSGWGRCPFHEDRTPSFQVKGERFRCFGCGAHGDVFDFVQKAHGTDFRGALAILGIRAGPVTAQDRWRIERQKRRQELRNQYEKWLKQTAGRLGLLIRTTHSATKAIRTVDDAVILNRLPEWEWLFEILTTGSDEDRMQLYREARNGRDHCCPG